MPSLRSAPPVSLDPPPLGHHHDGVEDEARRALLERLVRDNFQLVWRTMRRLVPVDAVDDAVQQVFVIAARKLDRADGDGEAAPRAFLLKTSLWVAHHVRRARARRREVADDKALLGHEDPRPLPDEAADLVARRRMLDGILVAMAPQLREVFVRFELEGLSSIEIAPLLGVPVGTVASRLRRAREAFHAHAKRLRAREQHADHATKTMHAEGGSS